MTSEIIQGNALTVLQTLPDKHVQCVVTSPPYWGLRDYGVDGQLGLERTPEEYIEKMVAIFHEVRRVLKDDGVLWLNLGDSYRPTGNLGIGGSPKQRSNKGSNVVIRDCEASTLKPKDLCGIPWRVVLALQADGWWLRQDIIWHKPNPMPESVTDRCTKSHEYIFLLSKSAKYYYDADAVKEMSSEAGKVISLGEKSFLKGQANGAGIQASGNGLADTYEVKQNRNKRSVWSITTKPCSEAHFATFPPEIPEICIKAGSKQADTILDPFSGAGTTGLVACRLFRNYIGVELNPEYIKLSERRIRDDMGLFV